MTCAYCQAPIEGPPYRACRSCGAPHHIDCWAEYGGCSIPGCAEAPATDNQPLPMPVAAQAAPVPPPSAPVPVPVPVPDPPAASPSPAPSGLAEPEAPDRGRERAPAPPPRPARHGEPWRWQRPALAVTVVVLLVGLGLGFRPLLDRMTRGTEADAPATTVPVTTPSTTAASSDDPSDSGGGTTGGAVARAIATIVEKGYTADPGDGRIGGTLSVFIGIASDSATSYNQKAFFFVGPELRYIGTDTTNPSRGIRVSWTTDMTVALEYQLYRADDANCCPSGGTAEVRYQWDGLQLIPLDEIPPDDETDTLSR